MLKTTYGDKDIIYDNCRLSVERTHIKYINVEDHEVKGEGESHGHQEVDVDLNNKTEYLPQQASRGYLPRGASRGETGSQTRSSERWPSRW